MKKNPTFPPSKIKKIIQENQQVGKLSNVVPHLVQRSLELFLIDIIQKVNQIAQQNDILKVNPSILKKAIQDLPKYQFMKFAVQDLQQFQCLKKKKSQIKVQKVQRKKSSKMQIQVQQLAQTNPSKRGRKKKQQKHQDVQQQQQIQVEDQQK